MTTTFSTPTTKATAVGALRRHLSPTLIVVLSFAAVLAYPQVRSGLAPWVFHGRANGILVVFDSRTAGSILTVQAFGNSGRVQRSQHATPVVSIAPATQAQPPLGTAVSLAGPAGTH